MNAPTSEDDRAAIKQELRERLRFRRRAHVQAMAGWERNIAFAHLPTAMAEMLAETRIVAIYTAIGCEAIVARIAAELAAREIALAKPRHQTRDTVMYFHRWSPGDDLEVGPFGIAQPIATSQRCDPDAILCPLVAFDRRLNRLGQGGGHYDRAFAEYSKARRIGVAWSVQEVDDVPCEPWDVPLHAVLTEREWIVAA